MINSLLEYLGIKEGEEESKRKRKRGTGGTVIERR